MHTNEVTIPSNANDKTAVTSNSIQFKPRQTRLHQWYL